MTANPEKFHAIFIKKDQTNFSGENLNIKGEQAKSKKGKVTRNLPRL